MMGKRVVACALLLTTSGVRACSFDAVAAHTARDPKVVDCATAIKYHGICTNKTGVNPWLQYACGSECGANLGSRHYYPIQDQNEIYQQVNYTFYFGGLFYPAPKYWQYYEDVLPDVPGVQVLYTCAENVAYPPYNKPCAPGCGVDPVTGKSTCEPGCGAASGISLCNPSYQLSAIYSLVCPVTFKSMCPNGVVPSPTPGSCSGLQGDPHLRFANGGEADFRGKHNTLFALATAANFQTNVLIEERSFSRWGGQVVHGTFVTKVFIKMRDELGEIVRISVHADQFPSFRVYASDSNTTYRNETSWTRAGIAAAQMTGGMGQACRWCFFMRGAGWQVTVNHRRIRKPLIGGKEVEKGNKMRAFLDTSFGVLDADDKLVKTYGKSTIGTIAPHGILGQGFDGSKVAVSGQLDSYESKGPEFTTSAQAEGAIEGVWTDYIMPEPFGTNFKYARFDAKAPIAARNVNALAGTKAKATSDGKSAGTTELHGVELVEQP